MKAKPLIATDDGHKPCKPEEATHLQFNVPGPIPHRILRVQIKGTRKGTGNWSWNGDTEKPTIKPSVLTKLPHADGEIRCHSFINDGKIQFLGDCSHEYAGQTLDLLDVE